MKSIIFIILFLGTLLAQSIELQITDLDSNEGTVMVALFNSKAAYENGESIRSAKLIITENQAKYVFEDIPAGEYAIKLFHDENLDGELNTGMFGIPTESYAFSNNAKGSFGPAEWDDAKFEVKDKNVKQNLIAE